MILRICFIFFLVQIFFFSYMYYAIYEVKKQKNSLQTNRNLYYPTSNAWPLISLYYQACFRT
ncbi:unnamed protein product, partial [Vitis vinifera]|uniref:Uncharacterized protein n=1 Tax=Vitis vinifera TaxID=29760 RepID=D7TRY7_VITVI